MHAIRRLRTTALILATATVLAPAALAQEPTYAPTGTLDATVDGVPVAFSTYVTVVPEPSESIDDARARAVAGRLVGREVATATTVATDPLVVNGVVAMAATLTLNLRGSAGAPEYGRDDLRELVLGIRLDPETLAWTGDPENVSVAYHPERWSGSAFYQLQDLTLIELQVERASDTTLRATGRIEATLMWREGGFQVTFDPERTLTLTVDFAVDPVVGDEALAALLGDE
ncbi:MAG: hypothetical protein ABR510_03680 [Trueperaceae bacterium]